MLSLCCVHAILNIFYAKNVLVGSFRPVYLSLRMHSQQAVVEFSFFYGLSQAKISTHRALLTPAQKKSLAASPTFSLSDQDSMQ